MHLSATTETRRHVGGFARLAVLLILGVVACAQSAGPKEKVGASSALIVLEGASAVQRTGENEGTVLYQLGEDHSPDKAVQAIKARLASSGWTPLQNDFLNPDVPTSLARGWVTFQDAGGRYIRQWTGQWEDASKRIAWYILENEEDVEPGGRLRAKGPITVRATVLSAAAARAARQAMANVRGSGKGR
jgi:hypothetical protein